MDLEPFIEAARRELMIAVDADGERRELAERMTLAITPTIRLMLLNALAAAADEITVDLAPGSVEVRLRGGEPSFAVTAPPTETPVDRRVAPEPSSEPDSANMASLESDDGPTSRVNLRLPEQLKGRIEEAAAAEGRSLNAWLVRAATAALESRGSASAFSFSVPGSQRYTGWVR